MTITVADKVKIGRFALFVHGLMERVCKDSLDPREVMYAVQPILDRGGESPLIFVDRTVRPSYPVWVDKILHPWLEGVGPSAYHPKDLELWLHSDQEHSIVTGHKILERLQVNDFELLNGCLSLRDLEEIQKKGIAFFREYFAGKVVFGWKSVALGRSGGRCAPCLVGYDGEVVLGWSWLGSDWSASDPALRLAL
jgi:hypothetical protein